MFITSRLLRCGGGNVVLVVVAALLVLFQAVGATSVSRVHIVSSCHLDVGFADTAPAIVNRYFDSFFLEAVAVAEEVPGYRFMTHAFLVSLFFDCPPNLGLHCPNATTKATVRRAFASGTLWAHAMPWNGELSLFPSLEAVASTLEWSAAAVLEAGQSTPSTVVSQRDVPGLSSSMIPLLRAEGVRAVAVGVNTASLPPAVPRAFRWRLRGSDQELLAFWHPHGYGGVNRTTGDCIIVESVALCPAWQGDNAGPPSVSGAKLVVSVVQQEFPGAEVFFSTYDAFVDDMSQASATLPVVEGEIADTWIYGVASDPYKLAASRVLLRASRAMTKSNFSRFASKGVEHTWGLDVKTFLHDTTRWSNDLFHAVQKKEQNFRMMADSWTRQRDWCMKSALDALPASEAEPLRRELDALRPNGPPSLDGLVPAQPGTVYTAADGAALAFSATGALEYLKLKTTEFVDVELGALLYQTYNQTDYDEFFDAYAQKIDGKIPGYFPLDFGKPNVSLAKPQSSVTAAKLEKLYMSGDRARFLAQVSIPAVFVEEYGAAKEYWLSLAFVEAGAAIELNVTMLEKTATRLPEATWLSFRGRATNTTNIMMDKSGVWLNVSDVVVNGSRRLHHVNAVRMDDVLVVETIDAGLTHFGHSLSAFPVPPSTVPDRNVFASCLHNNLWGTNYVMWFPFDDVDSSMQWRWRLSL